MKHPKRINFYKENYKLLSSKGFPIVPIAHGYKYPLKIKDWRNIEQDLKTLGRYVNRDNTGIGVICGETKCGNNLIAIDIDSYDSEISQSLSKFCIERLGPAPHRVGMQPKCLLIYKIEKAVKKSSSVKYENSFAQTAQIEILGSGQQFVAYGYHPDTKKPYFYEGDELTDYEIQDLTLINEDQIKEVLDYFELLMKQSSDFQEISPKRLSRDDVEDDILSNFKPPLDFSDHQIEKLLSEFSSDERDLWVRVGMAIYHQYSGSDKGFKVWNKWSMQSKKYDSKNMRYTWRSFEPDLAHTDPITLATLCYESPDFKNRSSATSTSDPTLWTKEFEVPKSEMDEIANPSWIVENLVIQGHFIVVVAEPNGGKTTLFVHLASEMVKRDYEVFYVNADISGGDAKKVHSIAKNSGFTLMLPDMVSSNLSMSDVVDNLTAMAERPDRYENIVFIFDTLKKMTDVINKSASKKLYGLLRALTAKGMTIIALGHTNKHKIDGEFVFEGTGDLRADCDELIYLIPETNIDGTMTITTKANKVRGEFKPVSFKVDKERRVTLLDQLIPTEKHRENLSLLKRDHAKISEIDEAILAGKKLQNQIVEYCREKHGTSEYKVRKLLAAYSVLLDEKNENILRSKPKGRLWGRVPSGIKNHLNYTTLPSASVGVVDEFDEFD